MPSRQDAAISDGRAEDDGSHHIQGRPSVMEDEDCDSNGQSNEYIVVEDSLDTFVVVNSHSYISYLDCQLVILSVI